MDKKLCKVFLWLSVLIFLLRVPLTFQRFFDQDEFEHIHAAWNISQGERIYSDFFENHPPLIHYLLQPFFRITGDTMKTVFAARLLMLLFTAGIFYFTYLIARDLWGRLVGALSVLMLSTMIMFLEKSLESRPDVPMTFFWFASLYLVLRGLKRERKEFFSAGILLGIGILFSPKALFGYLGVLFALCMIYFKDRERKAAPLTLFHIGILIPILLFSAWLFRLGNLDYFWRTNVLFNAKMSAAFRPHLLGFIFVRSCYQNLLFWVAGTLGIIRLWRMAPDLGREKTVLLTSLFFLLAGLFINPSPNRQYYLLFLPVLSMTAGLFVTVLLQWTFEKRDALGIFLSVVLAIFLLLPLKEVYAQFLQKNNEQIEVIHYVLKQTAPHESVFDCWTGLYLFRQNASYYHYLNLDILGALDMEKLGDQLIGELRRNNCKVVIMDRHFEYLPETVRRFIESHYSPSPSYPDIWIRNLKT